MDLVIMAAGMGSRFGGLKQVEPIDKNGNFIIDYSIYDAIKAGFSKVIFIIKEEKFDLFRQTVGKRVENKIEVEYVFQKGLSILPSRVKPWGTAHAIMSCKDVVKDNFAIINADDFYGFDAFKTAANFLKNVDKNSTNFGLVGYQAKNTITPNGATKRGVCAVKNGVLENIVESTLQLVDGKIYAAPLGKENQSIISPETTVSMNMFCFTPTLFEHLTQKFPIFLEKNKQNLEKCEFLIPEVVDNLIKEHKANVQVLKTTAVWQGVTYKEDKPKVVAEIQKLVDNNEYPKELWKTNEKIWSSWWKI